MGVYFRRLLIDLRRRFNIDRSRATLGLMGAVFATIVICVLFDTFVPTSGFGNIVRSLLLIPASLVLFSTGYFISLGLNEKRTLENPDWLPYRARYSQRVRIQFSIVFGAFLFVLLYIIPKNQGYTLYSSLLAAGVLGILAFTRQTSAEQKRSKLGIPDSRDVAYDFYKREMELEREKAEAEKKSKRSKS